LVVCITGFKGGEERSERGKEGKGLGRRRGKASKAGYKLDNGSYWLVSKSYPSYRVCHLSLS